jgi:catechol 2,3-dioxygenase-like lactoylglutathione lyase family enzyme
MLNTYTPGAALPTKDLARARAFYEGLGFTVGETSPFGSLWFASGDAGFMVYESAYAGTNKATAMAFQVPGEEFDRVIAHLRSSGATFDTFEMEGAEWDGDVLSQESMRAVWFRDPDDNILSVGTWD